MGKDYSKKDITEVFGYALTHPKQIPDELMEPLYQKWKAEVQKRTETWVCLNVGKVNQGNGHASGIFLRYSFFSNAESESCHGVAVSGMPLGAMSLSTTTPQSGGSSRRIASET